MTSEAIFQSDMKQSISDADVIDAAKGDNPLQLVAGVKCGVDPNHGRMLMSAKTHMLECGPCGFTMAPPKDED